MKVAGGRLARMVAAGGPTMAAQPWLPHLHADGGLAAAAPPKEDVGGLCGGGAGLQMAGRGCSTCLRRPGLLSPSTRAARRAAPAPCQRATSARTRGLEPLQVTVHVQRHIVQLSLLGGAVHKRGCETCSAAQPGPTAVTHGAAVAAAGKVCRRSRRASGCSCGCRKRAGAAGRPAPGPAPCCTAHTHRPKSFNKSVWRPPRVAPPVRRHGCWRGLGASAAPVTCN